MIQFEKLIIVWLYLFKKYNVNINFIQKSYPNLRGKVIHTNKSRKIFYPEVLSKNFLSKIYVTYSILLFTQKQSPKNLQFCDLFFLTLSITVLENNFYVTYLGV